MKIFGITTVCDVSVKGITSKLASLCVYLVGALCPNNCNYQGYCDVYDRCICFKGQDGLDFWTGADCSLRMCPMGTAWVSPNVKGANNVHPLMECSNRGVCDRYTGMCACYFDYSGSACEKTLCPNDCNGNGICQNQMELADAAGRIYATPWDAEKQVGCVCDVGYRGYDCSQVECPSSADPLNGFGNEAGRDCSGRGTCNYFNGLCSCFSGFYGPACQYQTTLR